jgi:hypothetical protein
MYEMLVGYPPFCSDSPQETYKKARLFARFSSFVNAFPPPPASHQI